MSCYEDKLLCDKNRSLLSRCITLKGEFTQYPFFVRFSPFFYVFASP